MPELQWIEVAAGEAWTRVFTPPSPPAGGIGSWALRSTFARDFGEPPLIKHTPAKVDATAGTFSDGNTSAETFATLGPGTWAYEAWRIDAGGETRVAFARLVITRTAGVPAT